MGQGSKKGSGYGGMQFVRCPRRGGNFKKSYRQIKSGFPVCMDTAKCAARQAKRKK